MRIRVICGAAVLLVVVTAAVEYESWRTAGHDEMRASTERIASAVARSDREAMTAEPLLHNHSELILWLLQSSPDLGDGYRVTVRRNGTGGHYLLSPEIVTHLAEILVPNRANITLGFRYDRETGGLEFVTASR